MIKKMPWEDGFDNLDISQAIEMPMNHESGKLGFGQEIPGVFRDDILNQNIYNTFDAIKLKVRTATTRSKKYKKGQLFIFTCKNRSEKLLCISTTDSYSVKDISVSEWSMLEGWNENYIKTNPNILNKFQFQYKYIKSI